MLIEQVDVIGTQSAERTLYGTADMIGAAVERCRFAFLHAKTKLGGYLHLTTERLQCLAHPLLTGLRTINLSRVEERHSLVVCPTDEGYHLVLVILSAIIAHHR